MSAETDVVERYFAAVNAEDWQLMATLWEPDAQLVASGARPRNGAQEILEYYPRVLAGYQAHHDEPMRRIVEGNTVVVEIRFTGTTVDDLPVSFEAVDVFDLVGGRIRQLSTWYDTHAVIRQVRGG